MSLKVETIDDQSFTRMRIVISVLTMAVWAAYLAPGIAGVASGSRTARLSPTSLQSESQREPAVSALQANSLCAKDEHIIFSCAVKRTAKLPAKIVSLCASRDLDKERGYLQYRFGLPGKVELEFPKDQQNTQQRFHYSHYFRYQVDLTEISFNIDGYEYQIFDDYNGEEKPSISSQGVRVTAPGKPKEVSFVCVSKPKADYSTLPDVLPHDQEVLLH